MRNPLEIAREFLFKRRRAYRRVLGASTTDPDILLILADLAKFCKAAETTMHHEDRASAMLEGRRQVWLRIQQHLNLSEEDLWTIYSRKE
jgi:hypothetical protein